MSQRFKIDLPDDLPEETIGELLSAVSRLDDVDNAGSLTARAVDPASIGLWVTLASEIVTVGAALAPVLTKIAELFRSKNVKRAKIVLPDGTTFELDELTPELAQEILGSRSGSG